MVFAHFIAVYRFWGKCFWIYPAQPSGIKTCWGMFPVLLFDLKIDPE
jgi:hypothetical protein